MNGYCRNCKEVWIFGKEEMGYGPMISWPILWGEVVNGLGPVSGIWISIVSAHFNEEWMLMGPTHLPRDLVNGLGPSIV